MTITGPFPLARASIIIGNNFADDARIIEVWRFENNLTAGKAGNDLTAAAGGVGYESGSPLEGSYSLDLENGSNQWAYRNDADLSAGFPLKSGDTTKKVSWALWVKVESFSSSYRYLLNKYNTLGNLRSLGLNYFNSDLRIFWGYNSGASGLTWSGIHTLTEGQIYHIGVAVDGVNQTALVRVWDATANQAYTYTKTDWGQELSVADTPFVVGNTGTFSTTYDWDGLIDEVVVANDLLSVAEFDSIRLGTFS